MDLKTVLIATGVKQQREVLDCCERSESLERVGDFKAAREAISSYWNRIGEDPKVDELGERERAELLLRAGMLTCRLGSSEQVDNYLEIAKNLLTNSLTLFEQTGQRSRSADACYGLGLCFRYEGAYNEGLIWLHSALERTPETGYEARFRILLLKAIIEKDMWRLHDAYGTHQQLAELSELVNNHSLLGTFRNEYALILKKLGISENNIAYSNQSLIEYEGARYHYGEAGNDRFLASTENNIGCLLLSLNRPSHALQYVERAIRLVKSVKDRTRLAEFLESKAQIFLALKRHAEAERVANHSVFLLRSSGQMSLLAQSLTTHGIALARQDEVEKAVVAFLTAEDVAAHAGDEEGAGRALLTLLEEVSELTFDTRRAAHDRVIDYLKCTQDRTIGQRLRACVKQTFDVWESEMRHGRNMQGDPFTWEGFSLPAHLFKVEEQLIERAIRDGGKTLTGAAKLLGVTPSCLNEKKKKFAIIDRELHASRRKKSMGKDNVRYINFPRLGPQKRMGVLAMPDDALSGSGIGEGDLIVFKKGYKQSAGKLMVLASQGQEFVGEYQVTGEGVSLKPTNADYETWHFRQGDYEVVGIVLGYIKAQDVDNPAAQIHHI